MKKDAEPDRIRLKENMQTGLVAVLDHMDETSLAFLPPQLA